MTPVACLDCGTVTPRPRKGRCGGCYQQHQKQYGYQHKLRRRQWAPFVAAGMVRCSRCGERIRIDEPWDLDHRIGRSEPSHAACNRAAKGTL